jgi:chromosome segregation ATPase
MVEQNSIHQIRVCTVTGGKSMDKKYLLLAAAACVLLCTSFALAELYQYTDKNGVVHYTDDYTTIPEQYRSQIDSQPETPPDQAAGQQPAAEETENNRTGKTPQEEKASQASMQALKDKREQLIKEKQQLDQTYQALLKQKKDLEGQAGSLSKDSEIQEYNRKVKELNERITNYREKEQALKARIEQYNKRIENQ